MIFRADPLFNKNSININNLNKLTNNGIRKGFYFAGKDLKKESIRLINKRPKSGRFYKVSIGIGGKKLKNTRLHQASAAGEAPARITGKLRKSINFIVHNHNLIKFGSEIDYGKYLENGTSKMKKRSFLKPSILNKYKNTTLYLQKNILKSINKV